MTELKWQPIETAPKDGSDILIFGTDDCGDRGVFIASFSQSTWTWKNEPEHYVWTNSAFDDVENVTHWMPLPLPPKGTET